MKELSHTAKTSTSIQQITKVMKKGYRRLIQYDQISNIATAVNSKLQQY